MTHNVGYDLYVYGYGYGLDYDTDSEYGEPYPARMYIGLRACANVNL
jgi:hypothetical protein